MAGIKVDCPTCGARSEFSAANPWRPFCSARCKTNDLGAWASDSYVIAGAPLEDASSDSDALPTPPRPAGPPN
jgi:endogenous inhibitor of DNA gyrase (YacG/DUF329 family)